MLAIVAGVLSLTFGSIGHAQAECKVVLRGIYSTLECDGLPDPNPINQVDRLDQNAKNILKETAFFAYRNFVEGKQSSLDARPEHLYAQKGSFFYNCLVRIHSDETIRQAELRWNSFVPSDMAGITFGSRIYLNGSYDESFDNAVLLAHEMTHIVQYNRFGDAKKFAREYFNNIGEGTLEIFAQGKIPSDIGSIRDGMSLEVEANAVEDSLASMGRYIYLRNLSQQTIFVAVHYQQCGYWFTEGWWKLAPGETKQITHGAAQEPIVTDNRYVYFHAYGEKGGLLGSKVTKQVAQTVFAHKEGTSFPNGYSANFDEVLFGQNDMRYIQSFNIPVASDEKVMPTEEKIVVFNSCSQTINVAIRYLNLAGQWTTTGWFELAPRQGRSAAWTKNLLFYYYGESKDPTSNRLYWGGTDRYYSIAGSSNTYGFKRVQIETQEWGKYSQIFRCEDAAYIPPPDNSNNTPPPSINTRALWFSNGCSRAIKVAFHYLNQDGQWTTSDWANFTPGDSRIVAYIGAKEPFYYYAESQDSADQLYWSGKKKNLTISNSAKQYGFRKVETNSDASMPWYQKISCTGVTASSAPAAPPVNPPSNAPAQAPVVNSPPPTNSGDCPYDVCVTDIVVSPDAPKRRSDVTFTATFVNKATEPRYYEWLILVFDPNKGGPNKGFGESPHSPITVPPGVSTATITFPVVTGPGPCMNLYVQAGIHKSATEKPAFPGRDGPPLSKYLNVCP